MGMIRLVRKFIFVGMNKNALSIITEQLKNQAKELGFTAIGISKARFLEEEAPKLEQWLKEDRHGKMGYMERNFDMRLDPTLLVPGAKSVVSLLYNYYPKQQQSTENNNFLISKYAYGEDYHQVIKEKLFTLMDWLKLQIGEINGRAFVDSAPVLERAWASNSGLGWIGKNGNLINKGSGSFYFISELILDIELQADGPVTDHCGTCTACIDACPTEAIVSPKVVDGSKCISYFTIELKESIPNWAKGKMNNWIFGCDICQDVCPWNRFASINNEPKFSPSEAITHFTSRDWVELTEEVFKKIFKKSPLKRTGYNGLKRNIDYVINE